MHHRGRSLRVSKRIVRTLIATACLLGAAGGSARAAEWQTILRARDFTDLLATPDVVWCATGEAGLLRFDRLTHTFENITRGPGSITSNHLRALSYDPVGRLWVGTADGGVSRLAADGKTWELINVFDGLPKDSVTTITAVGETLWIGTRGGIALWDGRRVLGSLPDGNTISFDTTFALPAITGVEQFADTVWLATPRGVGFARTSTNLTDWRKANDGLPSLQVDHLASDGHTLFAQSVGTLRRWDPGTASWLAVGGVGVVHSLTTDYGVVLVSSTLGIFEYHPGTDSFDLVPNSPASAPSDGDDPEAAIGPPDSPVHYAGSRDGLSEEPATAGAWNTYSTGGPPGNTYANIVIDGTRVYAATRSQGIGRWDGTSWYSWLPGDCIGSCPNTFRNANEVFAMTVDKAGRKWVSCWGYAMDQFADPGDPAAATFTHYWTGGSEEAPHTVGYGAVADHSGGVWFGMDTFDSDAFDPIGLDHYNPDGTFDRTWTQGVGTSQMRGNGKIRALTVDNAGRIWIGYAGTVNSGVDHFLNAPDNTPANEFKTVPDTDALDIWGLAAYGDSIWVLTDTNLRRIVRSAVPPRLATTEYQTLPGRPLGMRLMDVAENGDVYLASENGVRRFRKGGGTQDFTESNSPLASNDVRAIAVDHATGKIWIGTADGLNVYDPGYQPTQGGPVTEEFITVYPNPAEMNNLGVELRLTGASPGYAGGIYDLRGRLLHEFITTAQGKVFWDGRDRNGEQVKPGVYFVLARGVAREARGRFVLLH